MIQSLIELLAGFIALIAAAALSQFGVDLNSPRQGEREVHRVADCRDAPAATGVVSVAPRDC